jgi:hypothetical protein
MEIQSIQIIGAIIALVVGGGLYYWFSWRKRVPSSASKPDINKAKETELKTNTEPEEARVYDNITGRVSNETLPGGVIDQMMNKYGNIGRKWLRDGKWLLAVNKRKAADGIVSYIPVIVPATLENPPSRLRRAISHPYIEITHNVRQPKSLMQKYGSILIFAGVGVLLAFMAVVA